MDYTAEQQAYIKKVEEFALRRAERLGQDFHEVDFFCGAMVYFVDDNKVDAPFNWVFPPLTGRSIIKAIKGEED